MSISPFRSGSKPLRAEALPFTPSSPQKPSKGISSESGNTFDRSSPAKGTFSQSVHFYVWSWRCPPLPFDSLTHTSWPVNTAHDDAIGPLGHERSFPRDRNNAIVHSKAPSTGTSSVASESPRPVSTCVSSCLFQCTVPSHSSHCRNV